jgi:hypothetical protein
MASLFDKLESEAFRKGIQARSKEAEKWFAKNVKKLGKLGPSVLKDDRLNKTRIKSGDMVTTGTLTDAKSISAGQIWSERFQGL